MINQKSIILHHLINNGPITPLEALEYGVFRLGARIYELRNEGYNIKKRTISKGKKHFAQYYIRSLMEK